jgi:hypothetical protein
VNYLDARIEVAKGMYIVGHCDFSFFETVVDGLLRGMDGSFWSIAANQQGERSEPIPSGGSNPTGDQN